MRYNTFNRNSPFAAVMGKQHRARFENAFDKDAAIRHRSSADRKWVRDVLDVFAGKMELTFPQAVQVFKTGDLNAAYRAIRRTAEEFHQEFQKWSPEKQQWWNEQNPKGHPASQITANENMDDFRKFAEQQFIFSLSIRHRNERVYIQRAQDDIKDKLKAAVTTGNQQRPPVEVKSGKKRAA